MAAHTTTCHICGSTFTPKSATAKYCSPKCRKEAKRKADRAFMRKWRAENPEKNAERRKREDPKARRQRTKRCRDNNPERAHALAKAYRQANRETEAARQRKWRQSPYGSIAYKEACRRWAHTTQRQQGRFVCAEPKRKPKAMQHPPSSKPNGRPAAEPAVSAENPSIQTSNRPTLCR